ncbi:KH domain-containing protein [Cardamine amara subsp. amara]|uniref:KH domain-containing protein n=1 Tax=Cardamine amara subsp. amara TaxID=228776 RepID=A0ABD0Z087_CARAN
MAYSRNIYDNNGVGFENIVCRNLCPAGKSGSIIGKAGEIAKQIRSETKANMRIKEDLHGCDERVVVIYSTSEERNHIEDDVDFVCPAFDDLFKVPDMIVSKELDNGDDDDDEKQIVTVRMLVPSDLIGYLIGRDGTSSAGWLEASCASLSLSLALKVVTTLFCLVLFIVL